MEKSLPTKLPKFLYHYFWDTDAANVNLSKNYEFVIKRVLDEGSLQGLKWIFNNFDKKMVTETVKKGEGWHIDSLYFYANYLKIDLKEIENIDKAKKIERISIWNNIFSPTTSQKIFPLRGAESD